MNKLEYIVTTFNDFANDNGFVFAHGSKAFVNLKTNEANKNTFLHLYELDISPVKVNGIEINMGNFRGDFFIGMKSLISETFYKGNNDPIKLDYRYNKYFVPLYDELTKLINQLNTCGEIDLTIPSVTKRINYMDANMDGYLVNFTANVL